MKSFRENLCLERMQTTIRRVMKVGTSRCDVPARKAGGTNCIRRTLLPRVAPLLRGADGAARRPYQTEFMKTNLRLLSLGILFTAVASTTLHAQPPGTNQPTHVYRDQVEPHWFGAGGETNRFWYRVNLPNDSREFILVDATTGKRGPAFDHARLAK